MKYFLKDLYDKYDLYLKYKDYISQLDYPSSLLFYFQGIIDNHRCNLEQYRDYVMQVVLRTHSNYRLKEIVHGEDNLVNILFYPEEYCLNPIEADEIGWFTKDTLVFRAIDEKFYIFSPVSRINTGLIYRGEKWQKFK